MQNTDVMYGSCLGQYACASAIDSTINNGSCKSTSACDELKNTKIGYGLCNDEYGADLTLFKCNYCLVCSMKKK